MNEYLISIWDRIIGLQARKGEEKKQSAKQLTKISFPNRRDIPLHQQETHHPPRRLCWITKPKMRSQHQTEKLGDMKDDQRKE